MTLVESFSKAKRQHNTHKHRYTGVTEAVKWDVRAESTQKKQGVKNEEVDKGRGVEGRG